MFSRLFTYEQKCYINYPLNIIHTTIPYKGVIVMEIYVHPLYDYA